MKSLKPFWSLLNHYKYAITIVVGVAVVGFIDDNSILRRVQLDMQISDLQEEIDYYNGINAEASQQLDALKHDPKAYGRIARERYFMKADNEDIYVLSYE